MARLLHEPVMLDEVLEALALRPGAVVVDATLGLGGHALAMAERIAPGGVLVGLDRDARMLETARQRLADVRDVTLQLEHARFEELSDVMARLGMQADAMLFDLGLNSAQVGDAARGFSFLEDGPLDMRMDRSAGQPASALLNRWTPLQIEQVLREYGDERFSRAVARQVVERRKTHPLRTTSDLVECVLAAIPPAAREKRIHPATRTFQAVRIAVNEELEGLGDALESAAFCLWPGGRMAVLSYHSGEDRITKNVFRNLASEGFDAITRKPLTPSEEEIRRNPRSRSAKLRVLRRNA